MDSRACFVKRIRTRAAASVTQSFSLRSTRNCSRPPFARYMTIPRPRIRPIQLTSPQIVKPHSKDTRVLMRRLYSIFVTGLALALCAGPAAVRVHAQARAAEHKVLLRADVKAGDVLRYE